VKTYHLPEPPPAPEQFPDARAHVNVVDGSIAVTLADMEDADVVADEAGRIRHLRATVEPWGAEEEGMERADSALLAMGWCRDGDWFDAGCEGWACALRPAGLLVGMTGGGYYTEATHAAYTDVTGAEPIEGGGRWFTPARVTAKYRWCTQLGDSGWDAGTLEISGPWERAPGEPATGSGMVILARSQAPEWARNFLDRCRPVDIKLTGVGG
jgi:hypothetical protein